MGFPTIMYLSRSKVGGFLEKKQKKAILQNINTKLTLSLNKLSLETEFKPENKTEIRGGKDWPPSHQSLKIASSMEKQLRKNNQIGTMEDFINRNFSYSCYKLKGKLFLDEKIQHRRIGGLKSQGTRGILVLEGSNAKISLDISFENVAGVWLRNKCWEIWESGALAFFRQATSPCGYNVIGLFTYESESDTYFADCGILYFAHMPARRNYDDKELNDTIYNEYI